MSRILYSSSIEELIGKLAGSVFQDSYFGQQIRTRVSPRNPATSYQQLRRGEFSFITRQWRTMSGTDRATFASALFPHLTTLSLYTMVNINLSLINEPIIDSFTDSAQPATMELNVIEFTQDTLLIQASGTTTTVPAGHSLLVQCTPALSSTRLFINPANYTPLLTFPSGTDLAIVQDIMSSYIARYGQIGAGEHLCIKSSLINTSNGLRSEDFISCAFKTEEMNYFFPLSSQAVNSPITVIAATDLFTFSLPANKAIAVGDRIIINFNGKITATTGSYLLQLYVGAIATMSSSSSAIDSFVGSIELSIIDASNANLTIRYSDSAFSTFTELAITFSFDNSVDVPISLKITPTTSTDVTTGAFSIDLIKAP